MKIPVNLKRNMVFPDQYGFECGIYIVNMETNMIWNWIWNLNCSIWSLIWFIDRAAASTVLEPLKVLQKRAVRIVCGATYLAHTEPLYQRLNILKFENIQSLAILIVHLGFLRFLLNFSLNIWRTSLCYI